MHRISVALVAAALACAPLPALADPLPSWNDTATKQAIIEFVDGVTDPGKDTFVPVSKRVAVFDNDGTLWAEKPVYFQFLYALDRLKDKARTDPSILTSDTLKSAANGDMTGVLAKGKEGLIEVIDATHAGVSVDAFQADVRDWLATARNPETDQPYSDMTYQPMLELLRYLRDKGFSTYIVSGGGIHFIRALSEEAYNIPSQQVIGSTGKTTYEVIDGVPTVTKQPGIGFVDDGPGKPVGIDLNIGKRPIFAAGNSDGDFQMLEWTTAGDGPRFGMLVHHTDAKREFAYDRDSKIGRLSKGLDEAPKRGWVIVDMARDWSRVWSGGQ